MNPKFRCQWCLEGFSLYHIFRDHILRTHTNNPNLPKPQSNPTQTKLIESKSTVNENQTFNSSGQKDPPKTEEDNSNISRNDQDLEPDSKTSKVYGSKISDLSGKEATSPENTTSALKGEPPSKIPRLEGQNENGLIPHSHPTQIQLFPVGVCQEG